MATRTENLKLSKAETSDAIKSTLIANNNNFDKLDGVITRLRNNQLRGTASGTEININDAGEIESVLKVSGNSEQDSRSGKNLLKKDSSYVTKTSEGIIFVVNEDESVTLSGTNNGNYNSVIYLWSSTDNPLVFPAGTYKVRRTGNDKIKLTGQAGGNYYNLMTNSIDTITFNTEVRMEQVYLEIPKGTPETFSNFTVYPIIVKDTDNIKPYEPYGLMPSPDYPSLIMSVKSKSDNLFDSDDALVTKGGFVKQNDGSYYRSSVTAVNGIWVNTEGYTGQIAITGEMKWVNYSEYAGMLLQVEYTDGTKKSLTGDSNSYYQDKWGKFNLVSDKTKVVSKLNLSYGSSSESYFRNVMVNKGPIELPYQPYGYVPAEVKVEGKNLIKKRSNLATTTTSYGVTFTVNKDESVTLNGTNSGTANSALFLWASESSPIALPAGTYKTKRTGHNKIDVIGYSKETSKYFTIASNSNDTVEFDTDVKLSQIYLQVPKGTTNTFNNFTVYPIMVKQTDELEPYEPYKSKTIQLPLDDIELRSTPDGTRDTFVRVDGVWNKKNNIGLFYCDSTLSWYNQSGNYDTETRILFLLNAGNHGVDRKFNTRSLCNRFTETIYLSSKPTVQNASVDVTAFNFHHSAGYENYLYFKLEKSLLDTQDVAGFQKWLSENPTEVTYVLATPTYTPITDTALITALDELEDLILHKGYNYITATAVNGVKAHLDLSYYKDINIVLDNINASILSLGGGINV